MDNLELIFRFEGGRSKRDNLELDDGEDLPDIEDMKIEVSLKEQKKTVHTAIVKIIFLPTRKMVYLQMHL